MDRGEAEIVKSASFKRGGGIATKHHFFSITTAERKKRTFRSQTPATTAPHCDDVFLLQMMNLLSLSSHHHWIHNSNS